MKDNTLSKRKDGDIIEVRLIDDGYSPYYKTSARVRDNKAMRKLIAELREKGVVFPSSWFD